MTIFHPKDLMVTIQAIIHNLAPELDEVYINPVAPNPTVPYCVVTDISNIPSHYLNGANSDFAVRLQIDIYARREWPSESLWDTAERIYVALNKLYIPVDNAGNVSLLSLSRGSPRAENDALNRVTHEFRVMGSEDNT